MRSTTWPITFELKFWLLEYLESISSLTLDAHATSAAYRWEHGHPQSLQYAIAASRIHSPWSCRTHSANFSRDTFVHPTVSTHSLPYLRHCHTSTTPRTPWVAPAFHTSPKCRNRPSTHPKNTGILPPRVQNYRKSRRSSQESADKPLKAGNMTSSQLSSLRIYKAVLIQYCATLPVTITVSFSS